MFSVVQKLIVCNSNVLSITRLALQPKQNSEQQHAHFSLSCVHCDEVCPSLERGLDYLRNPRLNKGLAFTLKERQTLGLQGLLASNYKTQKEQVAICDLSIDRYKDPLNKYLYLSELLDTNERLFYSLIHTNVEKFLPLVYTPTVGLACQKYGITYKKPKGLFISIKDKGHVYSVIKNWPVADVRAVCVTDGERILGLGDLGAYGMGIPIGKLCLYTALAGVKPHQCLPITVDVGTNNETLLVDPLYIGLRHKRVRGKEYDEFIDEFMCACIQRYGRKLLIQFEDFALINASRLLDKYRDVFCTFNDDIQGTAAVIVAGIFGAIKITKGKVSDNVYLFLGAGSAGIGIAKLLVDAMMEEGLSEEQGRGKIYLFDIDGLLTSKRSNGVPAHAKDFVKDLPPTKDFAKAVVDLKPTCLIGVSTVGGAFTPAILQQMAKNAERPMIFALSNPTVKSECTPQQAYDNTEGRCIFASGSPFPPVKYKNKTYHTGQGNNAYVFPGIALGIIAANISIVSDCIFLSAARTVADMITDDDVRVGRVYPSLKNIRKISHEIAKSVIARAYKNNVAGIFPQPDDLDSFVESHVYDLTYPCYEPDFYEYPSMKEFKVKSVHEIASSHGVERKKK